MSSSGALTEVCPECGFDPAAQTTADLPESLRKLGRRYRAPLTRFLPGEDGAAVVRTRPAPDVWSALEYSCHTRDVLDTFLARTQRMLTEDNPQLPWWDHDDAPIRDGYNEQDPETVAAALDGFANGYADTLAPLTEEQWERPGVREDKEFTVFTLGVYALHEGSHHLLDVGRSLRKARGR